MDVNIGISNAAPIISMLSVILADETVLSIKTHGAHWNVEGIDFAAAHAFFGSQYEQINDFIDDVAERIRQLGGKTAASMEQYIALTQLNSTVVGVTSLGFYRALTLDHEKMIQYMRNAIGQIENTYKDCGTANFLTDMMEKHEKMAWMLRSHVE